MSDTMYQASGGGSPALTPAGHDDLIPRATEPEPPFEAKRQRRLLAGLQRFSSSPALAGLRRSKSIGSPHSSRSTLSCVNLAVWSSQSSQTGPSATPPSSFSGDSIPSTPTGEYPFSYHAHGQFPVRKIDHTAPSSPSATAPLPAELRCRHDGQIRGQWAAKAHGRTRPCPWYRVPPEICLCILSCLEPKELVRASRVSRLFYRLCFDGQLWTSLDASDFYRNIPAEALTSLIAAAGPFITCLNLRGCVQIESEGEDVARACKNLISATLEGCRNMRKYALNLLLRNNARLVHLNLTGLSTVSNTSCKTIAKHCPLLESLDISCCKRVEANAVKTIIDSCSRLKDLRATAVRGFDSVAVALSIFNTNNLERLDLYSCNDLTDEALRVMMQGMDPEIDILTGYPVVAPRKLRHLDLSRCTQLSSMGVRLIGHVTPNLERLRLSGCKSLTDLALEPILASTPRLTFLELDDLELITNSLLSEHLVRAPCAPGLNYLSLSFCGLIGDSGMLPVLRKCVDLVMVNLDNTRISDLVLDEAVNMVGQRSPRSTPGGTCPFVTLRMEVFDCRNITWAGVRRVLSRNGQMQPVVGQPDQVTYASEIMSLKCFYGYQMVVDEHEKRLLRGDHQSASRLESKWADYMQAGAGVPGFNRLRHWAREISVFEDATGGRSRARTIGSCSVM